MTPLVHGLIFLVTAPLLGALQDPPSPEAVEQARKRIREVFRQDYSKRAAADRRAFGRKLLQMAGTEKEEAHLRAAMYAEARDVGALAADIDTLLAGSVGLESLLGRPDREGKLKAFEDADRGARLPAAAGLLAEACLSLAEECLQAGEYELSSRAASRADRAARRARDRALSDRVKAFRTRIRDLQREHAKVAASEKKLKEDPDDPAANLAVGRFHCFVRADWEKGLALLAKGSDADLKALAESEQAGPADAIARARLADAWWDWGGKQKGGEKARGMARAVRWYEEALPELSALRKLKAEKRIEAYERDQDASAAKGRSFAWPGDRRGLVWLWESAGKANTVLDPVTGRRRKCFGALRGSAKVGRRGELILAGGAFVAEGANDSLLAACKRTNELAVEASLLPDNATQGGPCRIVSFSTDGGWPNFTVGQQAQNWIFRHFTEDTPAYEHTLCPLQVGRWHHVIVTYRAGLLLCYLNGKEVFRSERHKGGFANWKPHQLIIGDEFRAARDWSGSAQAVAIFCRFIDPKEAARRYAMVASRLR